jgi:iron complex outermembrane recepter protein
MKKFLLPVIFLVSLVSQAQTLVGKVNGKIVDGSQKTLASATISLLKAKDSSVIKFSVADKEGRFSFDAPAGKFIVSVTAVGHSKGFSKVFEVTENKEIDLETIELVPLTKSLTNVTVVSKKPLIEQKIDRTIVNVEASVTNVGSSALEVLEKAPGVTVDKDGNISLKGKEGVLVLVDGRPTQLSGTDLANLLRSMHSSQLDQVEIMTNPPAKYDAAGNAGIINIKTKKNKLAGYNGTVNVGYGHAKYGVHNEGLNFNYKVKKINFFSNLSHNSRKSSNQLTIQRNIFDTSNNIINYFDQKSNMINQGHSYNGKIGLDYFVSKKTTVGVVFNGFSNPGTYSNRNYTKIFDAGKLPESEARANAAYDQSWKNFSTNLNFRRVLDTAGQEMSSDLDFISYARKDNQLMVNSYYDASGAPTTKADTLLGALPQDIKIYSGRIDYTRPLKKGARFEAGLKSSIVRTDNNASYDSIQYGQIIHDEGRSNHFIYQESINAAYVNLSGSLNKKFNGQVGLRLENTHADGNQVTTGERITKKYTQLFPTAYLQYKANEKNNLGLNYGRRIRRPNYESLNPFIKFLDRYTYSQGNPNLRPQFSDNIELTHSYRNVITTTVNYNYTNDIIQQVIEQKGKDAYSKQANIAQLRQVGLSVNVNKAVNKWWTNNLYVNVYHNAFTGVVNTTAIKLSTTTMMMNTSQQFKFSDTWSGEVSGFYRTSGLEGVVLIKPLGMVSAGVTKQVLKNKGTLRFNVRDIFLTQKIKAKIKYGNVDGQFQETRDSRVFNLAFSYRFSKGKINTQKKRTNGSANEEQNRVGAGGN